MRKTILMMLLLIFINSLNVSNVFATTLAPPNILSESAIVLEANTGRILFEKNASKQMYPASLTKIATAIYAIENGQLDDEVKVSSNAKSVEGTRVYLEVGEKVTLKKLIQGLLINSGNDAGVAIAEHLDGNVKQFSNNLNTYLKNNIGVQNTNFENPHGLYNKNHLTTAEDLAKITKYALQNNTFKEIFSTKELDWRGDTWDTTLITHHKILKGEIPYEEVTGGKTGYINQSGFTLATTADNGNLSLIVITLNNPTEETTYHDTEQLLDYGFENYITKYIEKDTIYGVGNKKFKSTENLYYTSLKNEQISKKISKDGTLNITTKEGDPVAIYPLESINSTIQEEQNRKPDEVKSFSKNNTYNSIILLYLGIFLTVIVLYFWLKSSTTINRGKHQ
ncbi:D-alanyl-D-alanine carboxypeptidase [Ureibacillus chungkukjangi]|uniref:D-alanyl-D-alanine carboxypeptidase family protein n=1 Tax=Ureibacillus chungkukjangi TaxID=1202712 RepID=UPI00203DFFA4|nr:D-alanyl-D-alanine carboxypeptidase family protein [Ureibacillus chungkukjangi]MCM3390493.1 D-alanyl-D-alanine carboxypeptidase [Ureibacillus chungkukjangi]